MPFVEEGHCLSSRTLFVERGHCSLRMPFVEDKLKNVVGRKNNRVVQS